MSELSFHIVHIFLVFTKRIDSPSTSRYFSITNVNHPTKHIEMCFSIPNANPPTLVTLSKFFRLHYKTENEDYILHTPNTNQNQNKLEGIVI